MRMTPEEFVLRYVGLVEVYNAMSDDDKEAVTTEFVRYQAVKEEWVTRFVGNP